MLRIDLRIGRLGHPDKMPALLSAAPRIALIHSTQGDVVHVERAFADHWPEVDRINLLDDALNIEASPAGAPAPSIGSAGTLPGAALSRFKELTDYAMSMCAQGILYTCSQFGEAIEATRQRWSIPILKPQEALFLSALEHGSRLGLVTARASQLEPLQREFFSLADESGATIDLLALCVPEVAAANGMEQSSELDEFLRARAAALQACDVILLPDFSIAPAAPTLRRLFDRPVLAAPNAAVLLLKQLLTPR